MARLFQRKSNGTYYIDYMIDGRRIRESTGTSNRQRAEKCLHSRLGDIVQGRFKIADSQTAPFFKDFCQKYLAWAKINKRSWQRDWYSIQHLEPVFGKCRLSDIKPFQVEEYKIDRVNKVKPATVNREVALFKRVLNIAVEWEIISQNPIADIKMFKEPQVCLRYLTDNEADRLVSVCPIPFKWIVMTALHTGMRRGEILNLKWRQVYQQEQYLAVEETKNTEVRYIPMNQTMRQMFQIIPKISEYVFVQKNGQPYSWIGRVWKNVKQKSKVSCRFHDLRHTYASHLVMNGVDLTTVKELLGHKSLTMVDRYTHLSIDHKKRAVETLDGSLSNNGTNLAHSTLVEEFDLN
jgi:integrase